MSDFYTRVAKAAGTDRKTVKMVILAASYIRSEASNDDHEALVGLPDAALLALAGEATHQHFKGGLYRLLGVHRDSESGEEVRAPDGSSWLIYEHLYPHKRELWRRPASEFYEDVKVEGGKVPRFRELG